MKKLFHFYPCLIPTGQVSIKILDFFITPHLLKIFSGADQLDYLNEFIFGSEDT